MIQTESQKQRPTLFTVRFAGKNVRPDTVSLRSLAEAFGAVSVIIGEREAKKNQDELSMHLLRVRSGSARYLATTNHASQVVQNRLSRFGEILKEPSEDNGDTDDFVDPLQRLSRVAKRNACTLEILHGDEVLAKITPRSYRDFMNAAYVTGETSLYARIERVGGRSKLHCAVQVPRQSEQVWCSVQNEEMTEILGHNMFKTVLLRGTATWHRRTWRVRRFSITEVVPSKQKTFVDAVRGAFNHGGSVWANAENPLDRLAEIRGE